MGEIYKSICSCGYSEPEIFLGFGMTDWCPSLALCKKCRVITEADFHNNEKPICKKCAEELQQYTSDQIIKKTIKGKEYYKYYCPKCEELTLEMREAGCWD